MQRCRLAIKTEGGKKPTEISFIESVRLVAFCVEENNQTNIYTIDCIRFHVQAQPGWQTFKCLRDEVKSLHSEVHCSQILPI